MYYDFDLTIPKNITIDNQIRADCKLNYGVLRRVSIWFPEGCAKLVHTRIYRFESQIFPSNIERYFCDNDYHIEFEEYYPILEKPYTLSVRGYNEDDFRPHTINFRFLVIHPEAISQATGTPITEEALRELLGTYEMEGT
jgi:hypothetical protein